MKKLPLFLLAATASLAIASVLISSVTAEVLRGDAFITAMAGNTLSGKDPDGVLFNLYFLPGGEVTYQDSTGKLESGAWKLDRDGDVCVKWTAPAKADDGCFRVQANGPKVTWKDKAGNHQGGLRGEVIPLSMIGKPK